MKLLRSTKIKNVSHLESTEIVLVHCNFVNNGYMYTFLPNKSFGQLIDISHKNLIFLKTFNSEFSCIEEWFTDQNSKWLEIEDKTNITLVIN